MFFLAEVVLVAGTSETALKLSIRISFVMDKFASVVVIVIDIATSMMPMFAFMAMLAFVVVVILFACVMAMLACLMMVLMDAMPARMLAVPMGSCTRTRKMTQPARSVLFPKKGLPLLTVEFFNLIKYIFYDLSFLPSVAALGIFTVLLLCMAKLQEHHAEQQSGDEKLHIPFDL